MKRELKLSLLSGDFLNPALDVSTGFVNQEWSFNKGHHPLVYGLGLVPNMIGFRCTFQSGLEAMRDIAEMYGTEGMIPGVSRGYDRIRGIDQMYAAQQTARSVLAAIEALQESGFPGRRFTAYINQDGTFEDSFRDCPDKHTGDRRPDEPMKFNPAQLATTLNKKGWAEQERRARERNLAEAAGKRLADLGDKVYDAFKDLELFSIPVEVLQITLMLEDEAGNPHFLGSVPLCLFPLDLLNRSGAAMIQKARPILDMVCDCKAFSRVDFSGDSWYGTIPAQNVLDDWSNETGGTYTARWKSTGDMTKGRSHEEIHEAARKRGKREKVPGGVLYLTGDLAALHALDAKPIAGKPGEYIYTLDTFLTADDHSPRRLDIIYRVHEGGSLEATSNGDPTKVSILYLVSPRKGKIVPKEGVWRFSRFLRRWDIELENPTFHKMEKGRGRNLDHFVLYANLQILAEAWASLHLIRHRTKKGNKRKSRLSSRLTIFLILGAYVIAEIQAYAEHVRRHSDLPEPPP